jgi:prefoldin subunit 2
LATNNMSEAKENKPVPKVNPELQQQYNTFKSTIAQLSSKIGELEGEAEEHRLVLESLRPMDKDRKCFRMIGGALVEKTVGEVIPMLETNESGLRSVLETLAKDYQKTNEELVKWQKKNKVQIVQT